MDGWINGRNNEGMIDDGGLDGWRDEGLKEWIDGWMDDGGMEGSMVGWMDNKRTCLFPTEQ